MKSLCGECGVCVWYGDEVCVCVVCEGVWCVCAVGDGGYVCLWCLCVCMWYVTGGMKAVCVCEMRV